MNLQWLERKLRGTNAPGKSRAGVGMPFSLLLDQYGSLLMDAFNEVPYWVGSSLTEKQWRDVDVRIILDDEVYERDGYGDPNYQHENGKWVAMTLAYSLLGERMTGMPIDFQIQQMTHANANFAGARSAIGRAPSHIKR